MRVAWVAGLLGALLLILPGLASAEPRIALIIANSNYKGDIGSLKNPVNDGKLVGEALKKVGFNVRLVTDGDQTAMKKALNGFGEDLAKAGSGATGLFYYAGHGLQVSGQNYLVPVSANIKREGDVDLEALSAEAVLKVLNFSGVKVQIVILDACRNNPLMRSFRGNTMGLAKVDAPIGSFVAYSTAPGSVAADGQGANSPFATALAAEVQKPGASIEEMFRNVRAKVIADTDSQQVPWDSSSLTAPFYFSKDFSAAGSTAAVEQAFWQSIQGSTDPADFEAYLKKFPKGSFVDLAGNRVKALKEGAATAPAAASPQPTQTAALTEPSQPKSLGTEAAPAQLTPPPSNMKPGQVFKDCKNCPEMIVIPAGSFMMGSPESEAGRNASEGPQHKETIPRAFAMSKYVVTFAQYKEFMNTTGRDAGASCWYYRDDKKKWLPKEGFTFTDPGFLQESNSPAICLNVGDANAYAAWLSKLTGQTYRLPSEAEWEYAARAGTKTARYWGESADQQCSYANGADQTYHKEVPDDPGFAGCNDGYFRTAPVGKFKPNAFGLYDMLGNAWQITQDCLTGGYDGSDHKGAPVQGACEKYAIRGGSWGRPPVNLRAAGRGGMAEEVRGVTNSIRLVREF
jgi:formylglycine-generating enzyme required for sulfatase activity